jgi:hypothetical protein
MMVNMTSGKLWKALSQPGSTTAALKTTPSKKHTGSMLRGMSSDHGSRSRSQQRSRLQTDQTGPPGPPEPTREATRMAANGDWGNQLRNMCLSVMFGHWSETWNASQICAVPFVA